MFSDSTSRSSHPELFRKKGVLKDFAIFTGKHVLESLLIVTGLKSPTQVFFCEYCKTFFIDHLSGAQQGGRGEAF